MSPDVTVDIVFGVTASVFALIGIWATVKNRRRRVGENRTSE